MLILAISPALARDIQHLVHGTDAYLMMQKNSFLKERALDTLLISVSSILLNFSFNKLYKTKTKKKNREGRILSSAEENTKDLERSFWSLKGVP